MIDSDPDTVTEVLTGIVSKLYSNLSKKMQSTTMSSALTFYNDKEMKTQLSDYKTEISDWETKLADLEDRYYSQFTAMETALTKLQSQQSAISSYLS
jgi:flagellar hook-associated protein 2